MKISPLKISLGKAYLILLVLSIFILSCNNQDEDEKLIDHSIVRTRIQDIPSELNICYNLIINKKDANKENINKLLKFYYREGNKFHSTSFPHENTNVNVTVYTSKYNYTRGKYLGVITKSQDQPLIHINQYEFDKLSSNK